MDLRPYFDMIETGIFIDVGANIGKWSIYTAKRLGSHGKVISIEPFADNYYSLIRNININRYSNIIPLQIALSDTDGYGLMIIHDPINLGWISLLKKYPTKVNRQQEVMIKSLDNIISQEGIDAQKIKLIKIDVEGHELEVLKGGENLLKESSNLLIILESMSDNIRNVETFLKNYGFYVSKIKGNNYIAFNNKYYKRSPINLLEAAV